MSRSCPRCADPLSQYGVCGSCGFGRRAGVGPSVPDMERERNDELVASARRHYLASAPELTDQQWYNVCKFWPFVAAHVNRVRPEIGPNHPLDATARQGPVFRRRHLFDAESVAEREAIQADA